MSVPANAERAASADAALMAYMSRTSCDCEDCLADLLCDLMHWADKCGSVSPRNCTAPVATTLPRWRTGRRLHEQEAIPPQEGSTRQATAHDLHDNGRGTADGRLTISRTGWTTTGISSFEARYQPPRRIPVSDTGYLSHFASMEDVKAAKSPQDFAREEALALLRSRRRA